MAPAMGDDSLSPGLKGAPLSLLQPLRGTREGREDGVEGGPTSSLQHDPLSLQS